MSSLRFVLGCWGRLEMPTVMVNESVVVGGMNCCCCDRWRTLRCRRRLRYDENCGGLVDDGRWRVGPRLEVLLMEENKD